MRNRTEEQEKNLTYKDVSQSVTLSFLFPKVWDLQSEFSNSIFQPIKSLKHHLLKVKFGGYMAAQVLRLRRTQVRDIPPGMSQHF